MTHLLKDGTYESECSSGSHGNKFLDDVALVLFLRMRDCNSTFRLAYEVREADKFDDIVLIDDTNKEVHFIQVKHGWVKDGKANHLDMDALFPTATRHRKGDFDLLKYLRSYLIVNQKFDGDDAKYRKKYYVLTNRDFIETNDRKEWIEKIEKRNVNEILQFTGSLAHYLDLTPTEKAIKNLYDDINNDIIEVKKAIQKLFDSGSVGSILKDYCTPLKDVLTIDKDNKCSFLNVFNSQSKGFSVAKLYDMFKSDKLDLKQEVNVKENFLQKESQKKWLPPCASWEEIRDFFHDFSLSVAQPNDMRAIIEKELQKWMKTWIRPDVLGKLSHKDLNNLCIILEKKFEELIKSNKNRIKDALTHSDTEGLLKEIKHSKMNFESVKVNEFQKLYINRQISYEELEDDVCIKSSGDSPQKVQKSTITRHISDTNFVDELPGRFKDQQHILLVADPGMGKTSLLQFVAFEVQKRYDFHVFLVYFSGLVKELDNIKDISDFNGMINILKAVLSNKNCDVIKNADERGSEGYSVVLIMDGFDEIPSKYTERAIDMLKQLQTKKSIQIVISSRANLQTKLENIFGVKAMLLEPFSEEEQINYLKKMWDVPNSAEQNFMSYSRQLLEKFYSSVPSNLHEISGLPLMVRVLAEIHFEKFAQYLEATTSENKQQFDVLMVKLNIVQLYEQFIRKCFHFKLVEKYHGDYDDFELDSMIVGYVLEHQLLAMKLLNIEMFEDLCKNPYYNASYERFCNRCKHESENSLLVKVVNNTTQFNHLSYFEYFVAKCFCDHIFTLKADRAFSILSEHEVIRKFTMIMLEENEVYFDIIKDLCNINWKIALWACESGCVNIVSSLEDNFKTFTPSNLNMMLQASAMNGNVNIGKLLFKIIVGSNANSQTNTGETLLHIAAVIGDKNASEFCTAIGLDIQEALHHFFRLSLNAGAITPLDIATANSHKDASELLIVAKSGFYDVHKDFKAEFVKGFDFEDLKTPYIKRRIRFEAGTSKETDALDVNDDDMGRQSEGGFSHDIQPFSNNQRLSVKASSQKSAAARITSDAEFVEEHRKIFKEHRHILLVAEPGMGKTSLLQFLNFELQKQKNLHVGLMHFNDLVEKLDANVDDVLNMLKAAFSKEDSQTTVIAPEHWNDKNYYFMLLLDGFDEINVKYTDRIIEMLQQISSKTSFKFVMSTRMHAVKLLESKFNAMPMYLEPFSKDEQNMYLKKFWNVIDDDESSCKSYSEHLMAEFHRSSFSYSFELPLILRMVAEVHSDKQGKRQRLSNKMNIAQLFDQFARKCFNEKFKEKYQNIGDIGETDLEFMFMDFILEHQFLAMKLLDIEIPKGLFKGSIYKKIYKRFEDCCEKKTLLLKKVNNDYQFCHRLYSEYFIARYICDEIFTLKSELVISIFSQHDVIRRLALIMLEEIDDFSEILNDLCKLQSRTALWACESGCLKLVFALVEHIKTLPLDTLNMMLQVSAKNVYSEISKFLIAHNENLAKCTALYSALENSHFEVVNLLLSNNTDVNCQNSHGRTPLHLVSEKGYLEISNLLIEKGANLNLQDEKGCTPLHIASEMGHYEIAELLIERKADVNVQDANGCTPLYYSIQSESFEISKLLIDSRFKKLYSTSFVPY